MMCNDGKGRRQSCMPKDSALLLAVALQPEPLRASPGSLEKETGTLAVIVVTLCFNDQDGSAVCVGFGIFAVACNGGGSSGNILRPSKWTNVGFNSGGSMGYRF
jgi:hypothetical protein